MGITAGNRTSTKQLHGPSVVWQRAARQPCRFEEAIAETKRAVELDPLSPIINTDRAYPFFYSRRYDEAMAQAKKTIELDPGFFIRDKFWA